MSTAVLIHGCHLYAESWENIIWGKPKNGVFGRASKGLNIAYQEQADLIYWGTGASEKGCLKESWYTFQYAVTHACELEILEGFDVYEIDAILRRKSFIDTEAQSTPEEIANAIALCQRRNISRLILVSSPTHIARCLQEAEKCRAENWQQFQRLRIFATASDTCFANSTPADVVIIEPPHRTDRPQCPIHKVARNIFNIPHKSMCRFVEELDVLIRNYTPMT